MFLIFLSLFLNTYCFCYRPFNQFFLCSIDCLFFLCFFVFLWNCYIFYIIDWNCSWLYWSAYFFLISLFHRLNFWKHIFLIQLLFLVLSINLDYMLSDRLQFTVITIYLIGLCNFEILFIFNKLLSRSIKVFCWLTFVFLLSSWLIVSECDLNYELFD